MTQKKIIIYTDGSCKGNPGPGGWGAVIFTNGSQKPSVMLGGGEVGTTNNRMEMLAVIESLKYIHANHLQQSEINLYSDSNLVIQTLNQGWKRKANVDLWEELDSLNEELNVTYNWVRGHNENKWNEECDRIANAEAAKIIRKNLHADSTRKIFSKKSGPAQQSFLEIE